MTDLISLRSIPSFRKPLSTAAQIDSSLIQIKGLSAIINGTPLFESRFLDGDLPVCRDEKFAEQTSSARCSGFLISPDTLVTAGLCVSNLRDCRNYYWVFNFKKNDTSQVVNSVDKNDVYKCKKIIKQGLQDNPGGPIDYAVIKLDRPNSVGGLKISQKKINLKDKLTMFGHPSGLPLKITLNGRIKRLGRNGFITDLDAFGGNSGSAVVNAKSGQVMGILTAGQSDYVVDYRDLCARPRREDSEEAYEYVSSIRQIGKIKK